MLRNDMSLLKTKWMIFLSSVCTDAAVHEVTVDKVMICDKIN